MLLVWQQVYLPLIMRIFIIRGAAGLYKQLDGTRAYVACSAKDYIAVIDLKTLTGVNKIDVGRRPEGLAWSVDQE